MSSIDLIDKEMKELKNKTKAILKSFRIKPNYE